MKMITLLALTLAFCGTTFGQTMKIHKGAVTIAVPAVEAGRMTYGADGSTLIIMGTTYQVSELDSITVDRSVVQPTTVAVDYNGGQAHVLLAGDIAPQLTVNVQKADVAIVAAAGLQKEVYYTLRGKSTDGSFFMDGEYKSTVTLENLNLSNADGAAIDIANGKRIDVVVPDQTYSSLSDGKGTHKACFFVNGHPEFSGGGTLELTGNTKHAFASDEYTRFKPSFGTLKIRKAEGDGLHIEQYFKMDGGTLDIAGTHGDCIDVSFTKNPLDTLNGQAFVNAGKIKMEVASPDTKGFKVDSIGNMTISGGTIETVVSGDGCKGISVGGNLLVQQKTATPTYIEMLVSGGVYMPNNPDLRAKTRGIRVKGNFTLDGGKIQITITDENAKAIKQDGEYVYRSGDIVINDQSGF